MRGHPGERVDSVCRRHNQWWCEILHCHFNSKYVACTTSPAHTTVTYFVGKHNRLNPDQTREFLVWRILFVVFIIRQPPLLSTSYVHLECDYNNCDSGSFEFTQCLRNLFVLQSDVENFDVQNHQVTRKS